MFIRAVEMTRKDSEIIIEAIFDSVVRALRGGDKIEIQGFGSFHTRQRSRGWDVIQERARVEVPAKLIPYFKPSKELKGFGERRIRRRTIWPPVTAHL
jgi:integration host factor subunit beta